MIYCRTDFLSNPPKIQKNSVDLFLSSVPLDILDKECGLFFGLLNRYMRDDGRILIDAPVGYNQRTINLWHGAEASNWTKLRHHIVEDLYHPGENQIIHVYYKAQESLQRVVGLNETIKVQRKRRKAHPCEFCPDVVSLIIEKYSEPGDIVLDAFCGTGTVPGEADRLGRRGIGCDVRPAENIREEYLYV